MKAAYISSGNFPSRFAHSIQVVKNAQAWERATDEFCLYMNLDIMHFSKFNYEKFNSFYGIKSPFAVKRLPFYYLSSHWLVHKLTKPISDFLLNIYFSRVAKQLKKEGYDLVYTRTLGLPKYTMSLGIPTLLETHGPPTGAKEQEDMYKLLEDDNFLGLVTITEELSRRMLDHGLPKNKVFVAPDGVDLDMYEANMSKQQARKELGYAEQGKYALYVGHLYKDRGIQEIIYAAEYMTDVTFVIVGGHQTDIEYWQTVISEKGLQNVDLVGFVENRHVPVYQWMADVLLMPYSNSCRTSEWMSPLKLFEYMASGRAVIASKMKVFDGILKHQKNAYLVEPDDGESLKKGLAAVFDNEKLMLSISDQAQNDVKNYSWDARVKSILDFAGI